VEAYYHEADPFRWHLTAFLKALDEVPTMLAMALQNTAGFPEWFRPRREALGRDPLISELAEHRDFVVHRGMLVPKSKAFIGITEGRGMKLGMRFPLHPLEDSDDGMHRYLRVTSDPLHIMMPDEDSMPCVEREWQLAKVDGEVVEVCAVAWLRIGETILDVLKWLGASEERFSLDCRHASQGYRTKTYSRETLAKWQSDHSLNATAG
jgi:hypothetical protein